MRTLLLCCLSFLGFTAYAQDASTPSSMQLQFASKAEAAKLLSAEDEFVKRQSPFDRAARLKTDEAVDQAKYLQFVAEQTLDWSAEEQATIKAAWDRLIPRLADTKFRAPATVTLIKTTGLEEGDAAYTRATGIVLPRSKVSDRQPDALLAHELFHVLSRYDADLRDRLYSIIGFKRCGELQLPGDLQARRLTNPDAPVNDHYIEVTYEGETRQVIPVLTSRSEKYDKKRGGEFFNYLQFNLMAIEPPVGSAPSKPLLVSGKPLLIDPRQAKGFMEQIGKNTGYIIHPDEILADNFSMWLTKKEKVAQPELLEKLEKSLKMR